jgi:hypothetical protein
MTELTMDDVERVERVRAVTDNFFFWQGLRFIFLGPLVIVAVLANMLSANEAVGNGVVIACLVAATWASTVVGRRYRRDFGSVRPLPGAHATRSRVKWLIVYPLMIASLALDLLYSLPVFVSGLVWAAGLILYRYSTGGGRFHYFALAAAIAVLALAPVAAGLTSREVMNVMFLVLGAGFTACAWLDDREMRSILRGA